MTIVRASRYGLAVVALCIGFSTLTFMGCNQKETILDVDTPDASVEIERDTSDGDVEVDVDDK